MIAIGVSNQKKRRRGNYIRLVWNSSERPVFSELKVATVSPSLTVAKTGRSIQSTHSLCSIPVTLYLLAAGGFLGECISNLLNLAIDNDFALLGSHSPVKDGVVVKPVLGVRVSDLLSRLEVAHSGSPFRGVNEVASRQSGVRSELEALC
jgi:hypothetical protein